MADLAIQQVLPSDFSLWIQAYPRYSALSAVKNADLGNGQDTENHQRTRRIRRRADERGVILIIGSVA